MNSKALTWIIIIVALAGILYFGSRSLDLQRVRNTENPFEYDISEYEQSGADSVTYEVVRELQLDLTDPLCIALTAGDELLAGGESGIKIYNSDLEPVGEMDSPSPVLSLAADESGLIYAVFWDHYSVYSRDGQLQLTSQAFGDTAYFTAIDVYNDRVAVADAGHRIVRIFDRSTGEQIRTVGEKDEDAGVPEFVVPSPFFDLAIDEQGFLWVVNPGRHMFENFTLEGDFRTQWSRTSMRADGFSGCCNPSYFALMSDGSFVTSEKGIPRIKIHDQHGGFVTMVAPANRFHKDAVGLDVAVDSQDRVWVLYPKESKVLIFAKSSDLIERVLP